MRNASAGKEASFMTYAGGSCCKSAARNGKTGVERKKKGSRISWHY